MLTTVCMGHHNHRSLIHTQSLEGHMPPTTLALHRLCSSRVAWPLRPRNTPRGLDVLRLLFFTRTSLGNRLILLRCSPQHPLSSRRKIYPASILLTSLNPSITSLWMTGRRHMLTKYLANHFVQGGLGGSQRLLVYWPGGSRKDGYAIDYVTILMC